MDGRIRFQLIGIHWSESHCASLSCTMLIVQKQTDNIKISSSFGIPILKVSWHFSRRQTIEVPYLVSVHNLLHGDAASNLGVESKTGDGNGSRDLIGRWEGGRDYNAADLHLRVDATFSIACRAAAAEGQAWCAGSTQASNKGMNCVR